MVTKLLLSGIWLGLGAAVPIGPVNVEIARRTLRGGFMAGFLIGLGAVTVDVVFAVLTSLSVGRAVEYPTLRAVLGVAAAVFLGYLGVMSLWGAVRQQAIETDGRDVLPPRRNYLTGLLITATSPYTLGFWFGAVPGTAAQFAANPSRDLPIVCVGVFVSAISWVVFFSGLVSRVGQARKRAWLVGADVAGGLLLLGFAALTIWRLWN